MDQTLRSNRKRPRTEVMQIQGNSCDEIASMNDQPTVANGYNNNCNAFKAYGFHRQRRFLPIPASHHVFHSEDWKPKGETMFIPIQTDALINLQNIEQITVTKGTFFLCDENSRFKRSAEGIALELWRYDDRIRRLYISRSFVFTSPQVFDEVKLLLDTM